MKNEIVQLTGAEFDEAMDFMNLVFSQAHAPTDFPKLLPAAYEPTDEAMSVNYAIRIDGCLAAVVGMFPKTFTIGDATLRMTEIGGVSTHIRYAGQGLMSQLMKHCVALMGEQSIQLSVLGGQRQRYAYFGYERCGLATTLQCDTSNLRRTFTEPPNVSLERFTDEDTAYLEQAQSLHGTQRIRVERTAPFYSYCRGWGDEPFALLDGNGTMVGYLIGSTKANRIVELVTDETATAIDAVRAWVAAHGNVSLSLQPGQHELERALMAFCEAAQVRASGNWQVFDWPAVVQALLDARQHIGPLACGSVVIEIEDVGSLRLTVDDNGTTAALTDDEPALTCDSATAHRLLLGPQAPSRVLQLPAAAAILDAWCPLPLSTPRQDMF